MTTFTFTINYTSSIVFFIDFRIAISCTVLVSLLYVRLFKVDINQVALGSTQMLIIHFLRFTRAHF
jgi:hypothetical protein